MKYALCLVPIEVCNELELRARWQINTLKRLLSGCYKPQLLCRLFLYSLLAYKCSCINTLGTR